ncbi:DUF2244 domain-containing protein [Paracoccus xiamenensis]|uniref:DUF2244 domain-containing protein n=1 Tax=Paracoccus xiamenensis TaxID=2714901 RepID=UPI001F240AF4|nr:DUF2244 domain-containing protein [Paracoccus xiamenensis]
MRVLRAWPYRSLPRKGFVWFIGVTAGLSALPLIALLGRPVLWGLLPFMLAAIAGIWWAISRSYRSGTTLEVLELRQDILRLTRSDPGRADRVWQTNPYWIRAVLRPGPVESYLVLTGDHETGREVELGAFLSPEERQALLHEVNRTIADQNSHQA